MPNSGVLINLYWLVEIIIIIIIICHWINLGSNVPTLKYSNSSEIIRPKQWTNKKKVKTWNKPFVECVIYSLLRCCAIGVFTSIEVVREATFYRRVINKLHLLYSSSLRKGIALNCQTTSPCRNITHFWQMQHYHHILTWFHNGGQRGHNIFKCLKQNMEIKVMLFKYTQEVWI